MHDERKFYKTDDGNFLMFEWGTDKNNFQSEKLGRPIFDKCLFMSILSPGQQKSEVKKIVLREFQDGSQKKDEMSYMKFGKQIAEYLEKNGAGDLGGTPIEQWKEIEITVAAALRAHNIFTVEALAELPDGGLQAIGLGGREWQNKAKAYLAATSDSAGIMKAMKDAQAEATELRGLVAEMRAEIDALKKDEPKGKRKKA